MRSTIYALLALGAGFLGGIGGRLVIPDTTTSNDERGVRARSFELVTESGQTIAFRGIDEASERGLGFRFISPYCERSGCATIPPP